MHTTETLDGQIITFNTPKSAPTQDGEKRQGHFMHMFTGAKYWPLDPRADEVDIRDIARSLSTKARYAGHTKFPYSVAQHSFYVALYDVPGFNKPSHRLARLLHDASETYNGDLIRPLKYDPAFREPFSRVEELNERVISQRFGLPYPFEAHVKIADEAVTTAEVNQIVTRRADLDFSSKVHDETNVAPIKITEEHYILTETRFLQLFQSLLVATFTNRSDDDWSKIKFTDRPLLS